MFSVLFTGTEIDGYASEPRLSTITTVIRIGMVALGRDN